MRFQKGNNYGVGRPKGSSNKVTKEIKSAFEKLVADNVQGLQKDLDAMEGKDKIQALTNLSKYILPTLKQSEVQMNTEVNGVSDEAVSDILAELKRSK